MTRVSDAPPVPQAPYFDSDENAWIVTRYPDVSAVLKSPYAIRGEAPGKPAQYGDEHSQLRNDIVELLLKAPLQAWQARIKTLAAELLSALPSGQVIDLVATFIQPWCWQSARLLLDVPEANEELLKQSLDVLALRDADPDNVSTKAASKEANRRLDEFFEPRGGQAAKSIFLGVAQTTSHFLASAFYSMLRPSERQSSRQPNHSQNPLMIGALLEELLRHAGIVHTLFRRASDSFEIDGTQIQKGDNLILRLDSANHDPAQFDDPIELNPARRSVHLGLGAGSYSCIGAALVRMCVPIAILAVLEKYPNAKTIGDVEWARNKMLEYPLNLWVTPEVSAEQGP